MIDIIYRYDPDQPLADTRPASSQEAQAILERGNEAFSHVFDADSTADVPRARIIPVSAGYLGIPDTDATAVVHKPFAIVVGCADARVPVELILGQGSNDLFVLRVVGNVLGDDVLGSIDYALHHLADSLRIIVVIGHTGCGAVSAAVDAFLDPSNYLALSTQHHLRSIVNKIFPPVRLAFEAILTAHGTEARNLPGFRTALIETAVAVNAAMVASTLKHQVASTTTSDISVVFGVYDIETRHVGMPGFERGDRHGHVLLDPPDHSEAFARQAAFLAGSPRISAFLNQTSAE